MDNNGISLPAKMPLNVMSWQGIKDVALAGKAADYWKPGDTKSILIDGEAFGWKDYGFDIDAFILGINHNSAVEGKNHIHFGIGIQKSKLIGFCYHQSIENSPGKWFKMNHLLSNAGGWENSYIRTCILGADQAPDAPAEGTLLAALPLPLRKVMVPITKYTDNAGVRSMKEYNVTATRDLLWLPSEYEVFGIRVLANPFESAKQAQYDYFKNVCQDRRVYDYAHPRTASRAVTRSPACYTDDRFCTIEPDGSCVSYYANNYYALFVCFAV